MPNAVAGTNVVLCKMNVGMYMMILEKVNIWRGNRSDTYEIRSKVCTAACKN